MASSSFKRISYSHTFSKFPLLFFIRRVKIILPSILMFAFSFIFISSYYNVSNNSTIDEAFYWSEPSIPTTNKPESPPNNCGYQNCVKSKPGLINVHIVPHSHMDPGYKKTVEDYYYGYRNEIHNGSVQIILENVIDQLQLNPDRKFMFVEIIYFWRWWKEQTEDKKDAIRDLVQRGQFEFLNGGWVVNDEATTNYADIIDQMSLGLNILNETFGECGRPRVSLQTDTFGHSREQVLLNALMGFDAHFLGRVDLEDIERRMKAKEMEMVWSGSDNPSMDVDMFTGIHYCIFDPPPTFCFDDNCGKGTVLHDEEGSPNYNIKKRVDDFLSYVQKQSEVFASNNILVYMGNDYCYQDAEIWFSNIDKLIKYTNERQHNGSLFNLMYSTPSCYAFSLNEANITWPENKQKDFLPYHWIHFAYWTGFYTTRPALKDMIRQGSSLLQACKQMSSSLKMKSVRNEGDLNVMKEAMALMQHHDAITGTHSQMVHDDYVRILYKGVEECRKTMTSYYQKELPINNETVVPLLSHCQLNTSQCDATEKPGTNFVVNVYSSLGQSVDKYVRVPVISPENDSSFYQVYNPEGEILVSQLVPIPEFVKSIPGRRSSLATHELVFLATQVPPIGSKSYYVQLSKNPAGQKIITTDSLDVLSTTNKPFISNENVKLFLNRETGLLKAIKVLGHPNILRLEQNFYWYSANGQNCSFTNKTSSGPYVFKPENNQATPIQISSSDRVTIYRGELVQEIHQTFNEFLGQIIRLYKGQDHVEFDWVIGPIPIGDGVGKEIITRFTSDLSNNGQFYTDSNGRQTILRRRNQRISYNLTEIEPIASNYYPITSFIFLKDVKSGARMSLITDRAQGGGSIEDGELELLIHRRHTQQDLCLFNEPLDEMAHDKGLVVRGTHLLLLENDESSSALRSLVNQQIGQPQISFISTNLTFEELKTKFKTETHFLTRPLPDNVKLLTLEPRQFQEGEYLLRLEHIYDEKEHSSLSKPTQVLLKGLFRDFEIDGIQETTLGGNQLKKDSKRLIWKSKNNKREPLEIPSPLSTVSSTNGGELDVQLLPMEIRTFIIRTRRTN